MRLVLSDGFPLLLLRGLRRRTPAARRARLPCLLNSSLTSIGGASPHELARQDGARLQA